MIINAGIVTVVTDDSYPDGLAGDMLDHAGIEVRSLGNVEVASDASLAAAASRSSDDSGDR